MICISIIFFLILKGDLSKKEIYPNLFWLFRDGLLPAKTVILGYARSDLQIHKYLLTDQVLSQMKLESERDHELYKEYIERNYYLRGSYDKEEDFQALNVKITEISSQIYNSSECNLIFYLAIPPSVYPNVSELLDRFCKGKNSDYFTRLVLEKPFGRDLQSSNDLSQHLSKLFKEENIFRIDHFLGKEMVQSVLVLRFANEIFRKIWNCESIESIMIDLKEYFGAEGRGGYFDQYGIIRDVMQNHLLQILTLLAMEEPNLSNVESIRDEKVKVLQHIPEIEMKNVVLGQYVGNEFKTGYVEDETVPNSSITPTFATTVLFINNKRWKGVPFILRAGKALDESKTEIRIRFKRGEKSSSFCRACSPNELILRMKPDYATFLKISTKRPGLNFMPEDTTLDLLYKEKYENVYLPEAYQRLILDIIQGNQLNFV